MAWLPLILRALADPAGDGVVAAGGAARADAFPAAQCPF
jgi:hypothetical protein